MTPHDPEERDVARRPPEGARATPDEVDLRGLATRDRGPIHFVGIGGAGVSALAEAVLRSGGEVTGCDLRSGPTTERLVTLGARVHEGHDPAHVSGAVALITSAAVPSDHPELDAARERGLPVLKRARALGSWVNRGRVLAVAGTHGKTSTTAMIAEVLSTAGLDPTAFVGGRVPSWDGNYRHGRSDLFVVEADEYDRSFHELIPDVAVVTNVEADHLDIYGDLEGVRTAFRTFVQSVPQEPVSAEAADGSVAGAGGVAGRSRVAGRVVVCGDDPEASRLLPVVGARGYAYGLNPGVQLRAVDVRASRARDSGVRASAVRSDDPGTGTVARPTGGFRFRVVEEGRDRGEARLGVPGLHNVRNALAAAAVARFLGVAWDDIFAGLERYRGVGRRFQRLGSVAGIEVVDDYAHHPTEVRATLQAARAAHPERRLVAVFQPHLFSRTRDFHEEFGVALALADEAWVTDVYPAREEPVPGVTGELVADATRRSRGRSVHYHADLDGLAEAVAASLRPGDLCVTMGAGSVEVVGPRILEALDDAVHRSVAAGGGKHG